MLVYGDLPRAAAVAEVVDAVAAGLLEAASATGAVRRDLWMRAFIDASGLVQGLVDAEFEARGHDDLTPLHAAAMRLMKAMARGLDADAGSALAELAALAPTGTVTVKTPEGYGFYAVYPECYRRAARAYPWPSPPVVIGLRSIGMGLAGVVAAATGATTAVTLRPCGPPFARTVRPSPTLCDRFARHPGPFAIADEGPGLSGSSFGGVADLLEDLGVAPDRIVFQPSHAGHPGPEASPRHRARWARAQRAVSTLDDLLRDDPMEGWFAEFTGPATLSEDISAGAWRAGAEDLPANPRQERRKFRLTSATGAWLAKFAGLGRIGEAKLARARALHAAGFTPQPVALRRGFLLERWEAGARLDPARLDRPRFVAHLARYLAFRARAFPASAEDGAEAAALCGMALKNAGIGLAPPPLGPRVHVDARLHPWEWLQRPDGSFCKTDALDHACAHDLIGCQDIAWDVAGAAAEFDLSPAEVACLVTGIAAAGGPRVDPAALAFFDVCYSAFQLGLWSLADAAPAVQARLDVYRRRLARIGTAGAFVAEPRSAKQAVQGPRP